MSRRRMRPGEAKLPVPWQEKSVQKARPHALPEIGFVYGGGFVTGFYRQGGRCYVVISAGAAYELRGVYGRYGLRINGADSATDSRANTEAMAAAGSDLARRVLALSIGGFSDWAIPARDVQELQYRSFKPTICRNYCWNRDGENHHSLPVGELYSEVFPDQTTIELFRAWGSEAFSPRLYWSSTQRSADCAFYMLFEGGCQLICEKCCELLVRPVRSELVDSFD